MFRQQIMRFRQQQRIPNPPAGWRWDIKVKVEIC
jgi:hypothetical protein